MNNLRDADIVIKEIAWVMLNHGHLSLGDMTLWEFVGQHLDLSDAALSKVRDLLNETMYGESK